MAYFEPRKDNKCQAGHRAFITDRGGKRRIAELTDISQVSWDRRRDETSDGSIFLQGGSCARQASILESIEPMRHELVLFRGSERVWEGPINRVGDHSNWTEVAAHDVSLYAYGRPLSKMWDNTYAGGGSTEVTTRMEEIFAYEFSNPATFLDDDGITPVTMPAWESLSPPANVLPHLVVHHFPNEAGTSALTTPFQMSVGEHLDNYAQSGGIDYTVVGRAIHIWDVSRGIGQTRTLTEADFFGEVIVTGYGSDFASFAFTVSQDGRYGGAGANSDFYGPWAKMFTVYDEDESHVPTQADLNSQARRNLSGRSPVPVEVRIPDGSGIRLSNGLGIMDLVPGVRVPLRATLNARRLVQTQKIDLVKVTETADGETIQLTLLPATREDSDEEE